MPKASISIKYKGGAGSGHHGHVGRPGKRGGSGPGSGGIGGTKPSGDIFVGNDPKTHGGRGLPAKPKGWARKKFGFQKTRTDASGSYRVGIIHSSKGDTWSVQRMVARPHGMWMRGKVARDKRSLSFSNFQQAFEFAEDTLAGKLEKRHSDKGY